jgi:thiol-disulfide isomerase/thioredoxin
MINYFSVLKLILFSFLIFLVEILVWIPFEFNDSLRDSEHSFNIFVNLNLLTFYICFAFFQMKKSINKFYELLLLGSIQISLAVFVIFAADTAKIRSVDLLFFLLFTFSYYLIVKQFASSKKLIILLIVTLVTISFLFYQKIGSHLLAIYFNEKETYSTTSLHQEFYYLNEDSTETVYPFRQKNKVYFIEFWNRSCPSCIKNLPSIEVLQNHYKSDTNVAIISLYCPVQQDETRHWVYQCYLKNKKNIPKIKYYYTNIGVKQKFNIVGFPHFYLIGKDGKAIEGTHVFFDQSYSNNIYEKIETLKNQ